jgi:hypothetical protein
MASGSVKLYGGVFIDGPLRAKQPGVEFPLSIGTEGFELYLRMDQVEQLAEICRSVLQENTVGSRA